MRRTIGLAILLAAMGLGPAVLRAEDIVEKFDNGATRVRYSTDGQGRKVGSYLEYFENGKVHIKATYLRGELTGDYTEHFDTGRVKIKAGYKLGKLNGPYTGNYENGKPAVKAVYADGKRHGAYAAWDAAGRPTAEQIFWNDRLLYGRSQRMIKEALDGILGPGASRGEVRPQRPGPAAPEAESGPALADPLNVGELRRLNAHRYLVGLASDVTLSVPYCDLAQAAADICAKIGTLDHTPKNPGMPEDEYKKAYQGTSHSNLHMGRGTRGSVDLYMDDSDPSNIGSVGHRRWCLNPSMQQCGFGQSGKFSAMYAHDRARKNVPDYDLVAYPAAGFMPGGFFGPQHAWHVSVNPTKYKRPDKAAIKVTVMPLAPVGKGQLANPDQRGAPLEMDFFNVDLGGYGISNAIIFRPKGVSTRDGAAYWVQIKGLQKTDGGEAPLEYVVHFVDL